MAICYRHTYYILYIQINIHDQFLLCVATLQEMRRQISAIQHLWRYNTDHEFLKISPNYVDYISIFLIELRCFRYWRWTKWNFPFYHMLIFTVDIFLAQFALPIAGKCSLHHWRKTLLVRRKYLFLQTWRGIQGQYLPNWWGNIEQVDQ